DHITYSVAGGVRRGQSAKVITERAVFEVVPEGLILTEVAPGIDVRRDVLEQMEFAPWKVADDLKPMDARLFSETPRAESAGRLQTKENKYRLAQPCLRRYFIAAPAGDFHGRCDRPGRHRPGVMSAVRNSARPPARIFCACSLRSGSSARSRSRARA